ncbi:MAG: hypothetical protein JNM09_04570 [Blastocatellia bacterium]|nr:hypothetical protein [Blastocatellia bacterium]
MEILKVKPWPFDKNEPATLNWILSPIRKISGYEVIAIFKTLFTGKLERVPLPLGILPALRIGRVYIDGKLADQIPQPQKLDIPNIRNGTLVDGFKMPPSLYSLLEQRSSCEENLWRFELNANTYFLPCLEMIRAFFIHTKTLANKILIPNGLDTLIGDEEIKGNELILHLDETFPLNLLKTKEMEAAHLNHLIWLRHNPSARMAWEFVARKLYAQAIKNNPFDLFQALSERIPLQVIPPFAESLRMEFTSVSHGNQHLVLEILGFEETTPLPFDRVSYTHPRLEEPRKTTVTKIRKIPIEVGEEIELDTSGLPAKNESNPTIVKTPAVEFRLLHFVPLKRIYQKRPDDNSPKRITVAEETPVSSVVRSANPTVYGGLHNPLEFAGLTAPAPDLPDYQEKGLNQFLTAVNVLASHYQQELMVYPFIGELAYDKSFSKDEQNHQRKYAWVSIQSRQSTAHCFILELARVEGRQIATLFIKAPQKVSSPLQEKLTESLNKNNGHFNPDNFSCDLAEKVETLRHSSLGVKEGESEKRRAWREIYHWANRMASVLENLRFKI